MKDEFMRQQEARYAMVNFEQDHIVNCTPCFVQALKTTWIEGDQESRRYQLREWMLAGRHLGEDLNWQCCLDLARN